MHNVCTALLSPGRPGLAIQVEEPASSGECGTLTSVDRFAAQGAGSGPAHEQRSLVPCPAVSILSVDSAGPYDHPSRDADALASGGLSLLLALEVALIGGLHHRYVRV